MAEGRISEERGGGDENIREDYAGEVAFEFRAVLEHGEGEGDDGDVEEGAEDIACAWMRETGTLAVEELEVAGFGCVCLQGVVEGGSVGKG